MKFQRLETYAAIFSNHWKSCVAGLLLAPIAASAQTNLDTFVVSASNVVAGQFFKTANHVEIEGTLSDDAVIVAAGSAKLSGTASNDLWMGAAQSVEITGHVGDHARLAALSVTTAGTFDRDLLILGQTINLATNNHVGGSVDLRGARIVLEGIVDSNATLIANSATISGRIRGTLNVTAAEIELLRGAVIEGDLVYTSPNELLFDRKLVTVQGKLVHNSAPPVSAGALVMAQLTISAALLISAFLTGVLFTIILPRFTGGTLRILRHSPLRCASTGLFCCGIVGIFFVFAVASMIAAPFGTALAATLGVFMYLGNVIVALTIGGLVLNHHGQQPLKRVLLALTVGLGLLYTAKSLPYLGLYISFFAWFAGSGALILNMIHSQRMTAHQEPPPLKPPDAEN